MCVCVCVYVCVCVCVYVCVCVCLRRSSNIHMCSCTIANQDPPSGALATNQGPSNIRDYPRDRPRQPISAHFTPLLLANAQKRFTRQSNVPSTTNDPSLLTFYKKYLADKANSSKAKEKNLKNFDEKNKNVRNHLCF